MHKVKKMVIWYFSIMFITLVNYSAMAIDKSIDCKSSFSDKIALVVNDQIFTLRDLLNEEHNLLIELEKKGIKKDKKNLREDTINRIIEKALIVQESNKKGIFVNNSDLNSVIDNVLIRNNLNLDQMRLQLEREHISWDSYLEMLRYDIYKNYLCQHIMDEKRVITNSDIDIFLKKSKFVNKKYLGMSNNKNNQVLSLAQILIRVPENATSEDVQDLYNKAKFLRNKLLVGDNFSDIAREFSDGPESSIGGFLGKKTLYFWPDLFIENINFLSEGQISEIFRSKNGFHILKVLSIDLDSDMESAISGNNLIEQVYLKQILVKKNFATATEDAILYLSRIREAIVSGNISFKDAAKHYSQDINASQGGDMGWVDIDSLIPEFKEAIKDLGNNNLTDVINSPEGYCLLKFCKRRIFDITERNKRNYAYQYLFDLQVDSVFSNWFEFIKSKSQIDIKFL
ncbi:MAG: peptidylprolyl isomerase [Candidatus Kinetoplastibacterium crithidii]|nr:MAG: peptidylprolyl isomerase [Candidatus Kinetoplastibacterium crithidii]